MTIKHVIDGLMQATRSRHWADLTRKTGIRSEVLTRIGQGKQLDMKLGTIVEAQKRSGVSANHIFAWYALPDGAVLGRIHTEEQAP